MLLRMRLISTALGPNKKGLKLTTSISYQRNSEQLELAYWRHLHFMLIRIRCQTANAMGLHLSMAQLWL